MELKMRRWELGGARRGAFEGSKMGVKVCSYGAKQRTSTSKQLHHEYSIRSVLIGSPAWT